MRLSVISIFALLLLIALPAGAQEPRTAPFVEISGPQVLAEADDGRVEVISFFWYGCPSCSKLDEPLTRWAAKLPKDVRFIRKHVAFNRSADFPARVFETLRVMDIDHSADLKIFKLFIQDRKPITSLLDLPRLAETLNIDEKKLIETFNSKEVDARMAKLSRLMDVYNIEFVPTMVVDGRYVYNIGMTRGGAEGFIAQTDELIKKQRAARKAGQ